MRGDMGQFIGLFSDPYLFVFFFCRRSGGGREHNTCNCQAQITVRKCISM